jgi:type II secretory pathway component GspD/PulD (secretin)
MEREKRKVENMNVRKNIAVGITGAAVLGIASFAIAQGKVEDQDLMKLLETVNQEQAVTAPESDSAQEPLSNVLGSMKEDAEGDVDAVDMSAVDDATASTEGNLISVRLNKVGLEEAINLFAQLSGANIIVPELADAAQISVNLKDVEWRPALQSILDTYNYELYQRVSGSNVYSVRRRPAGAPEPQVVETFVLKYATVPNVATLIRDLLPQDAKISEFASRNMLVVKSSESSLSEVRAVLERIDKVRQQVFIESKFMELSDDVQKDLGIDWQVLRDYEVTSGGNLVSYGKENTVDAPSENLFKDMTGGSATFAGNGEYTLLTSVLDVDDFQLVLSALEENKGVNIVSNPKIIVANEELANISIVRREPNIKQERQQSSTDGALDNTTFELDPEMPFFDFGIKLDVTPSINTSSNITVKIHPSLTRKFGDKPAGDNTYPIIDEKSIETVFNLASGQTAAIGGLTEVTENEIERKVPLLGSIPLVGRLFSWTQNVNNQSETVIFVTVGLANTQDIDLQDGMPVDSELARRQVIRDRNSRTLRDQSRVHFETQEGEKLGDTLKAINTEEAKRVEKRLGDTLKAINTEEAKRVEKRQKKLVKEQS